MPISRRRHTERTPDGEPLYIIETPNEEFEGKRANVLFYKGVGKTKFLDKAKLFSGALGYTVKIHEDAEPWEEVTNTKPDPAAEMLEDSTYGFDNAESEQEVESY